MAPQFKKPAQQLKTVQETSATVEENIDTRSGEVIIWHPENLKLLFYRNSGGSQASYYNFINGVRAGFCEARFASVNTQTGHLADGSGFTRPVKPAATAPLGGATAQPPGQLLASAHTHSSGSTAGVNAHAGFNTILKRHTSILYQIIFRI